jgi:hypothetical protein
VVRLEQVLVVAQTPDGQLAPAGHASTGVQVHVPVPAVAVPPLTVKPVVIAWQSAAVV